MKKWILIFLVGLSLSFQKTYTLHGDGVHDDYEALQAWFDGKSVVWCTGEPVGIRITGRCFYVSKLIEYTKPKAPYFLNNIVVRQPIQRYL